MIGERKPKTVEILFGAEVEKRRGRRWKLVYGKNGSKNGVSCSPRSRKRNVGDGGRTHFTVKSLGKRENKRKCMKK